MTVEVYREGVFRSGLQLPVQLKDAVVAVEYGRVVLSFREPKGFGNSVFNLHVLPESYTDLARAMMYADPHAAMRAFGAALQEGFRQEPPQDQKARLYGCRPSIRPKPKARLDLLLFRLVVGKLRSVPRPCPRLASLVGTAGISAKVAVLSFTLLPFSPCAILLPKKLLPAQLSSFAFDSSPSSARISARKASTRASVIGRYRFARSPLIAIYSATSGAGEVRSRLFEKSVLYKQSTFRDW
jgi:hypothetical protein